jgi:CubicO group peptidase (beta-lactamase class C family)
LSWDERTYPYTDARNDHARLNLSTDPVRYALARPLVGPPGTTFVYNSGIAITLGEIIYKVSGVRADKFAERYLFAPLGIADYYWWKYPNGTVQTGGGLQLRSRDMAKIGYLFLNGGRWQGKQIVSEEWVKESTKPQVGAGQLPAWAQAQSYGYQWWLGAFRVRDRVVESYSAQGRGGQFIFVFPALQMVAVFTGWNDNKLWNQPLDMLQQYILPAVR